MGRISEPPSRPALPRPPVTRSEKHFEEFAEHTRLKHLILDKYLNAWARKLLLGTPARRIWFVDAFAGEGRDGKGNIGSPLIASRIAEAVNREMETDFSRPGRLRVVAIEQDPGRYERLCRELEPYVLQKLASAHHTTLPEVIDAFRERVREAPVLYFLDPFGMRGLIADLFPKLLAGPHNEVLLLFSDSGASRLHAVLNAKRRDATVELRRQAPQHLLFPAEERKVEEEIREAIDRHARALDVTQPAAAAILREVFGPVGFEELRSTPADRREEKAVELYVDLLKTCGARYVLSFPVRNERNHRVYRLLYATRSAKGLKTMKEAMSASLGQSALPEKVRARISVPLRVDVERIVDQVAAHFAGRTVEWRTERGGPTGIWTYALEETEIFPAQRQEFRDALIRRFPPDERSPLTISFP